MMPLHLDPVERVITKLLAVKEVDKVFVSYQFGKFSVGSASKHLTRSGRRYRKFINLRRFISGEKW